MHAVVRCPHCEGYSRIPAQAVGQAVACPRCDRPFATAPEPEPPRRPTPPVAAPAGPAVPLVHPVGEPEHDSGHDHGHHGPASALIGLALLPLGIPLLWTAVLLLSGVEPVFSYALPVAIALGMSGVCLGVVFTADWPHPTRVRGVILLTLLGYAAATFLFFVQKDWLEAARKRFGNRVERWHEFKPPDGPKFTVKTPGRADPDPAADPIPGWELRAFRCADPKQRSTDVYLIAYGTQPADAAKLADDAWFAAVKKAIARDAGGDEPAEEAVSLRVPLGRDHPGREYRMELPDKITNRTVRVYRVGARVFYLAAEGVALPADAPDVKTFFRTFAIQKGADE